MPLFCTLLSFLGLVLRQMNTSPRMRIAMTAIPPTDPPAIAPMGNEDLPADVEDGVADVDDDEVADEVLVEEVSPLAALVTMLETAIDVDVLVAVVGL